MVTVITHAFSAVAIGCLLPRRVLPRRAFILGAVCAGLPDIDVVGFHFGIRYGDLCGHRGLSHSIAFALVLAAVVTSALRNRRSVCPSRWAMFVYLFVCTGLHGVLDAMTNGGRGIAFFSPFDPTRYWMPWDPIQVAPIGIGAFFSEWGWRTLQSEFAWVWLPSLPLIVVAAFMHRRSTAASVTTAETAESAETAPSSGP